MRKITRGELKREVSQGWDLKLQTLYMDSGALSQTGDSQGADSPWFDI